MRETVAEPGHLKGRMRRSVDCGVPPYRRAAGLAGVASPARRTFGRCIEDCENGQSFCKCRIVSQVGGWEGSGEGA